MSKGSEETLCAKCTKAGRVATCYGCQQSYCTKHFIKHRLELSDLMDNVHQKYESFLRDLDHEKFEQPLLSSIYAWERKSMRKIQEIAEKARNDLREWMERTKVEVKNSLEQIKSELDANEESENFTEIHLQKWSEQLDELRNLLEKPSTITLVQDKRSSSTIHGIKIAEESNSISESIDRVSPKSIQSIQEHFIIMSGPCKLSEDDRVITHSNYRAGLSQISGTNQYSSGKYSIHFLIERKGSKNLFLGIHSPSTKQAALTFDKSFHGWWNLDYAIINGECEGEGGGGGGGNINETIQSGDRITFLIDCEHRQIELEHHRTKRLLHLPIKLETCPFPWKILLRLLSTGDCVRIL